MVLLVLAGSCNRGIGPETETGEFDGERAYLDLAWQVEQGPRIPGTASHQKTVEWIASELNNNGWQVEIQVLEYQGKQIQNIIGSRGKGEYILLGAHYDTRIYANRDPDPDNWELPVPGANDGASGVAVLLELSRVLPMELPTGIKLVFFDAEDNGGIETWDWILGSRAYVENLEKEPLAAIIIDMIGDTDLEIYYEKNSDWILMERIWDAADSLGYGSVFIPEYKHSILDDHTPFVEAGIPAVDLIDFDYPSWHTTADTIDKVAPESLDAVGDTLLALIMGWGDELQE